MGARVSAIAVPDGKDHLYTFYVGFWTGGLWKTTNNGTTFEPIFDGHDKLAIGAVATAPSNPDIVWVGTGDAFTSRSSLAGDGVYKSIDAGKTWDERRPQGLPPHREIAIDPANPNTVYVAAMGHLFSETPSVACSRRRMADGRGRRCSTSTSNVGVIDLVMNPRNPAMLYAATYDKKRMPWQIVNGGPGTGIYKTCEWRAAPGRVSRADFRRARSAASVSRCIPRNPGDPLRGDRERESRRRRRRRDGGFGEVYRTQNGGRTWTQMSGNFNVSPKGPYYFSQIFVDPKNDQNIYVTQDNFFHSSDGGKTWNASAPVPAHVRRFSHAVDRSTEPEPHDRRAATAASRSSYDGGRTSDAYANIPVGENYKVFVDVEEPYNIYAGIQDHEHWKGPSNVPSRGVDGERLARARRRRRHLRRAGYDGRPLCLHDARVRPALPARSEARLSRQHRAAARRGRRAAVSLHLGSADLHLATQQQARFTRARRCC